MAAAAANPDITAFYGYRSPLSNMHLSTFALNGVKFRSVEQAFQYLKALEFNDKACAAAIKLEWKPFNCKALGRRVENYDDDQWKDKCIPVMLTCVLAKFISNNKLTDALLQTGSSKIVEAAPRDRFWGAGMGEAQVLAGNAYPGQNWMGTILERVRELLRTKSIQELTEVVNPGAPLQQQQDQELSPEDCFSIVKAILTKTQ